MTCVESTSPVAARRQSVTTAVTEREMEPSARTCATVWDTFADGFSASGPAAKWFHVQAGAYVAADGVVTPLPDGGLRLIMEDRTEQLRLASEGAAQLFRRRESLFQRDQTVGVLVERLVDGPHAAVPELIEDAVTFLQKRVAREHSFRRSGGFAVSPVRAG